MSVVELWIFLANRIWTKYRKHCSKEPIRLVCLNKTTKPRLILAVVFCFVLTTNSWTDITRPDYSSNSATNVSQTMIFVDDTKIFSEVTNPTTLIKINYNMNRLNDATKLVPSLKEKPHESNKPTRLHQRRRRGDMIQVYNKLTVSTEPCTPYMARTASGDISNISQIDMFTC